MVIDGGTIYAPGEDPAPDVFAKGILVHEFGHHIAANRTNPPFDSIDYGTKRWASYEDICAGALAGDLYPGAEDSTHYMLNPGEAFAESYRLLNEQRLYPDATALSLLEQDVLTPWTADTTQQVTAKLTAKVRTRTFNVSTPYDGTLGIVSRQSGSAKVSVSLLSSGSTVKSSAFTRLSGKSLSTTVCGQRAYKVRVTLPGPVKKTTKTTVGRVSGRSRSGRRSTRSCRRSKRRPSTGRLRSWMWNGHIDDERERDDSQSTGNESERGSDSCCHDRRCRRTSRGSRAEGDAGRDLRDLGAGGDLPP